MPGFDALACVSNRHVPLMPIRARWNSRYHQHQDPRQSADRVRSWKTSQKAAQRPPQHRVDKKEWIIKTNRMQAERETPERSLRSARVPAYISTIWRNRSCCWWSTLCT